MARSGSCKSCDATYAKLFEFGVGTLQFDDVTPNFLFGGAALFDFGFEREFGTLQLRNGGLQRGLGVFQFAVGFEQIGVAGRQPFGRARGDGNQRAGEQHREKSAHPQSDLRQVLPAILFCGALLKQFIFHFFHFVDNFCNALKSRTTSGRGGAKFQQRLAVSGVARRIAIVGRKN
jgi:hypothetical protein